MSIASTISPNKLGAGAASLLALTSLAAHADVIRVDGLNQKVINGSYATVAPATVSLDVDNNGTNDISLSNNFSASGYFRGASLLNRSVTASAYGVAAGAVAAGTLIGPSMAMSATTTLDLTTTSAVTTTTYVQCPIKSYPGSAVHPCGNITTTVGTSHSTYSNIGDHLLLPFKFHGDQQTQYGWLDIAIRDDINPLTAVYPFEVTLNGYGYDNTGAAVVAGAAAFTSPVPEPSSLLMLATGLAGMAAYRRKSRRAAASPA